MSKYLSKEEIYKKIPYNRSVLQPNMMSNPDEAVIIETDSSFVEESLYYTTGSKSVSSLTTSKIKKTQTRAIVLPRLKDDFLITGRPGLGYVKREKPKFIKFQRGQTVEFMDNEDMEAFSQEHSYSLYIMKKWLTPDIDNFIKKNIIKPRAINNWKKLYLGVVEKYILEEKKETRHIEYRYKIYRESYLRFKDSYYALKEKNIELERKCEELKEQILAIDLNRIQKLISSLKGELDYFRDEYIMTNKMNEDLYSRIMSLSNIHFENTLRNAFKNKKEKDDYDRIVKTSRVMNVLNSPIDFRKPMTPKWFGFTRNENLKHLWSLCGTPHWLINFNDETEVPEIIELEREVVIEIIKISKFRRTKNGLNSLHFFLRRRGFERANGKGAEIFRQTFNKLFKFHEDFDNKRIQYGICIEYLVMFYYSKRIMLNFDYLMAKHLKEVNNSINESDAFDMSKISELKINPNDNFPYSDHNVDDFIGTICDLHSGKYNDISPGKGI